MLVRPSRGRAPFRKGGTQNVQVVSEPQVPAHRQFQHPARAWARDDYAPACRSLHRKAAACARMGIGVRPRAGSVPPAFFVVYTELEIWGDTELIWMISARPATGKEKEDYEAGLHK